MGDAGLGQEYFYSINTPQLCCGDLFEVVSAVADSYTKIRAPVRAANTSSARLARMDGTTAFIS